MGIKPTILESQSKVLSLHYTQLVGEARLELAYTRFQGGTVILSRYTPLSVLPIYKPMKHKAQNFKPGVSLS